MREPKKSKNGSADKKNTAFGGVQTMVIDLGLCQKYGLFLPLTAARIPGLARR